MQYEQIDLDNLPFKSWRHKNAGLFWITLAQNARKVVEIGVGTGDSTLALLSAVTLTDGHVWSIDIRPAWQAKANVVAFGLQDRWTFIQSDSREYEWDNGDIDVLFIDGNHSYSVALSDLTRFGKFAKTILMHDTNCKSGFSETFQATRTYSDKFVYYPDDNGLGILNE